MNTRCYRFGDRFVRVDLCAQPAGVSDQLVTAAPFLIVNGGSRAIMSANGTPIQIAMIEVALSGFSRFLFAQRIDPSRALLLLPNLAVGARSHDTAFDTCSLRRSNGA